MEAEGKVDEVEQKLLSPGSAEVVKDLGNGTTVNSVTESLASKDGVSDHELGEAGTMKERENHAMAGGDAGQQDTGPKTPAATNGNTGAVKEQTNYTDLPLEVESVTVPPHWHAKPCVHVKGLGGLVTKEDLLPTLGKYGTVSSIVFENERMDSAITWFEHSSDQDGGLIPRVVEGLNNHEINGKTLVVEAFQSDSLLFIGNLTPDIDDALLRKMFEPHGTIERAFVLRNAEGRSKCYGFVEYNLKSQASSAKVAMGNLNMDGRVLRVEWSDCQKIADMFSTVLFVDRVPRVIPNVEMTLKTLFGRYGKVKDMCLVLGINQQFRGFGFIEFYHSTYADRAHQALDGYDMGGSKIRVSFANPSKSASSYKSRMGSQAASSPFGFGGRSPAFRGQTGGMPVLGPRFQGPGRPAMTGMGSGSYGRGVPGVLGQGFGRPPLSSGAGMLGPASVAAGRTGHVPLGLGTVNQGPGHLPGTVPRSSAVMVQAKNQRAPNGLAANSGGSSYQHLPQGTQQTPTFQGTSSHNFQQPIQSHYMHQSQAAVSQERQPPYQSIGQEQQQNTSGQYQAYQQDSFYQQQATPQAPASVQQQYPVGQQYSQQKAQQQHQQVYVQQYNQVQAQQIPQSYQTTAQQQSRPQYYQQQHNQQAYADYYPEQQSQQQMTQVPQTSGMTPVAAAGASSIRPLQAQELSQQHDYGAFYQQGTVEQTAVVTQAATLTGQNTSVAAGSQQSIEAQWAAYYAAQAAYQQTVSASNTYEQQIPAYGQQNQAYVGTVGAAQAQPAATVDVGQKRTAEQMDPSSQQTAYNYQQQTQIVAENYAHQLSSVPFNQQQPSVAAGYQQPSTVSGYQHPTTPLPLFQQQGSTVDASSVQQAASSLPSVYQPTVGMSPYQQPAVPQASAAVTMYDYSKRPRF
ncbi:hypothetical protein O6H91_07G021100 [Diphasiastrum complanatum]|uniref:Uncharacterized protein n=3 Tax=Diphasiastrum complanatum TaxID=34168 RepID=A0ACC2D339_DIPCM|nr:hypothetical protein O6H91_07G021100 [Diphasiastrum complanatum]KAJ7548646.1 hypothetical protein O6H91_07G021100 [Diphasiastrum complanatum]KAJ7548648.1 hypothetical protein O6H91_07G021100 [Diphasiastrum complanatum]